MKKKIFTDKTALFSGKNILIIFALACMVFLACEAKSSLAATAAAPVCNKIGDPCTLSTGQSGTCHQMEGKTVLYCYPNTTLSGSAGGVVNFNDTNSLKPTTVESFLASILSSAQKIIVTIALVFIVIGAFFILTSAGVPDMVERGKKAITMAVVGLAIGIAAPSILKELTGILGWGTTTDQTVNKALTISQIAVNVLNFLLGIAGILSLIMLVIGGIVYLTSAGDEDRIASGKKIFTYSLIGVVIIFSAMVLAKQIALFFV